jgi:dihydroorotase/N-acyl-D-amino-acid deacylase
LAAQRVGLTERGVIKKGMWADIDIFDPAKVRAVATFQKPNQLAKGMDYVLVDGKPVISQGKMTGALSGHVLYGPGYTGS